MISIILVEPEFSSNLGAIARILGNFEIKELILVNPKCEITEEAMIIAKHAKSILENAKIVKKYDLSLLKQFDLCVATTSKTTEKANITRNSIYLKDFCKKIEDIDFKKNRLAIIFGREGDGLFNNELELCDYAITIPTSDSYRALNLSHSVAIVCYELFNMQLSKKPYVMANKRQKQVLFDLFNDLTGKMDYDVHPRKTTNKVLKKVIEKSMLSAKEISTLLGFVRKLKK